MFERLNDLERQYMRLGRMVSQGALTEAAELFVTDFQRVNRTDSLVDLDLARQAFGAWAFLLGLPARHQPTVWAGVAARLAPPAVEEGSCPSP